MLASMLVALAFAQEGSVDDPERVPEIHAQIDWQGHPAMHIPWWMFGEGLTDRVPRNLTWKHQFKQTVSEPALARSEVRIFLAAAMASVRARNPTQARRLVLEQLAFVEAFISDHAERYALARTPTEARQLLTDTDKMVIVHSIEGGHELLWTAEDVQFWADQGVALVTLIHVRDEELGASALRSDAAGPLINRKGAKNRRKGRRRGLTERGLQAIVELDRAGILVDFSHMAPLSLADALDIADTHDIAPVITHGKLAKVVASEAGVTDGQLAEIYRLGGVFSVGLGAGNLRPLEATVPIPGDLCPDTLEVFAWHSDLVHKTLLQHLPAIFDDPEVTPQNLTDAQRTRLAVGWSSDWNGWTSHSKPVYGKRNRRCRDLAGLSSPLDIDTRGLAQPGLLPQHWQRVGDWGLDLDPMQRSAERFLRLWEDARGDRADLPR